MAMTITDISKNTQAILIASDKFVNVEAAPQYGETIRFSGYPSAFHYYENTDSNTATISQHRRSINYTVQIVQVFPDSVSNTDKFKNMYGLIDFTVQKFDETRDLKIGELPRACDILRPVVGEMARVMTNDGEGLMATIRLTCEADVKHTAW